MSDVIKLLPDSVANQIAAGEVIQRPASAVKELMENAIDAGTNEIKLLIKDAGRTLIQVIDNGCGMSETDARMAFERHATSKINNAKDLFSLHTMGFRGEALASICAIAHVELKTKRKSDDLGTLIINEGSEVKTHEPCTCDYGTSIAIKNLFYNVPARRNFLKSDQVELRHITDEFLRLAIAHPHVSMSYYHNNNEVYFLPKDNLKKRIINCFTEAYNQKLIPIEHQSDIVSFKGFIGKPEHAKKTRGEQFFFTNNRFMKHNYLNHAVFSAYESLIKNDSFPSFFVFIDINPELIDVNIHPTKTEIKFQDERIIYSYLHASVKRALGLHNAMPSIDFEKNTQFDVTPLNKDAFVPPPSIKINPTYNPFDLPQFNKNNHALENKNKKNWQTLYDEVLHNADEKEKPQTLFGNEKNNTLTSDLDTVVHNELTSSKFMQIQNKFILTPIKSGLMAIDQQAAHERILYEKFLAYLENNKAITQQELFPLTIELAPADTELTLELIEEIKTLGFDIVHNGACSFDVNGTPTDMKNENIQNVFEKMLETYKCNQLNLKLDKKENMAASLAKNLSVKSGCLLHFQEMNDIVDRLFACDLPYKTPSGKPTLTVFTIEDLESKFNM